MSIAVENTLWHKDLKVWFRNTQTHESEIFQQGVIVNVQDKQVEVKSQDGQLIKVSVEQVYLNIDSEYNYHNEVTLLKHLQTQYQSGIIQTLVGRTLIIMNPNQTINQHADELKQTNELYNDVNSMTNYVYQQAMTLKSRQSIIIQGLNGSGKSRCQQQIIDQVIENADMQTIDGQVLKQQIMASQHILQMFGCTSQNNYQSNRYGCQLHITMDSISQQILGVKYQCFQLERTGDANIFDIFYYLANHIEEEWLSSLQQLTTSLIKFKQNDTRQQNQLDKLEFRSSMQQLGFDDKLQSILSILSSIILIGDIKFDASKQSANVACEIVNIPIVDQISGLLQITSMKLQHYLTNKQKKVGLQFIDIPMTSIECENSRDWLARDLYERLFYQVQTQINSVINSKVTKEDTTVISLIQVPTADTNNLDQLMTNYINEKIIHQYIDCSNKQSRQDLELQGIKDYNYIDYNTQIIDLFEKASTGIFHIIDEQSLIISDDQKLLDKLKNTHKANTSLVFPQLKQQIFFTIKHQLQSVEYKLEGFRTNNKDELPPILQEQFDQSKFAFIKQLYSKQQSRPEKTQLHKIKNDMNNLVTSLNTSQCFYISCISPNKQHQPSIFEQHYVYSQLKHMGVLMQIELIQNNYPIRLSYYDFFKKFHQIRFAYHPLTKGCNYQKLCNELIIKQLVDLQQQIYQGTQIIYLQPLVALQIQNKLNNKREQMRIAAIKIYKNIKVYQIKKGLIKFRKRWQRIKDKSKSITLKVRNKLFENKVKSIQQWYRRILFQRKKLKYLARALIIQQYIKRVVSLHKFAFTQESILKIQCGIRCHLAQKLIKKLKSIKLNNQIIKAIQIQSAIRGLLTRNKHQGIIEQIRNKMILFRQNKRALQIQKYFKGQRTQRQYKLVLKKVKFIQGYIKMRMLSTRFRIMKFRTRQIQRNVRIYMGRLRLQQEQYQIYLKPMIDQFQVIQESNNLSTNSIKQTKLCQQLEHLIITKQDHVFDQKIQIMSLILDLELLTDISEIDSSIWIDNYIDIWSKAFEQCTPIQGVEVGETHTTMISASGRVYSWGNNDYCQLGNSMRADIISVGCNHSIALVDSSAYTFGDNSYNQLGKSSKLQYSKDPIKIMDNCTFVMARGNISYAISKGDLFLWGQGIGLPAQLEIKKQVDIISAGHNFIIILSKGQMWGHGENSSGQLGLGDLKDRSIPSLIDCDRIIQIECGFNHCIARSVHKLYTWGNGDFGQLGYEGGSMKPKVLEIQEVALQIGAGYRTSVIIAANLKLYWSGSNKSIKQSYFTEISMESKYTFMKNNTFMPLKLQCSWSKTMSVISCNFGYIHNNLNNNYGLRQKVLTSIISKWGEQPHQLVSPPFNSNLSKYIMQVHSKKCDNKIQQTQAQQKVIPQPSFRQRQRVQSPKYFRIERSRSTEKLIDMKQRLQQLTLTPQKHWNHKDIILVQNLQKSQIPKLLKQYDYLE